jgi:DNA-binding transcriptional MerR regulator
MSKALEAFRTISEVADDLDVPKHVLRFWEVKFPQIRPMKRGGGRRYYRPEDLVLLRGIQHLLHAQGYTIKGVQKILREQGVEQVKHHGLDTALESATPAAGKSAPTATPPASGRVRTMPKSIKAAGGAVGSSDREAARRAALLAAVKELDACRKRLTEGVAAKKSTSQPPPPARTVKQTRAAR